MRGLSQRIGTPTQIVSCFPQCFKFSAFCTLQVVNTFGFVQLILKLLNLAAFFKPAPQGELLIHAGFDLVMEGSLHEVRGCVTELGVLSLDLDCEVPECHVILDHSKEFDTRDFLPILWKVAGTEFGHEVVKREFKIFGG